MTRGFFFFFFFFFSPQFQDIEIFASFSTTISKFPNFWVGNKNTDYDSVLDEGTIAISAHCLLMDGWVDRKALFHFG
jgi:hypothetical protein